MLGTNIKIYAILIGLVGFLSWYSINTRDSLIESEKNLNRTIEAYESSINILEKTSYQKGMNEASKKEVINLFINILMI